MTIAIQEVQKLIKNGYLPYPVAKGSKRPALATGKKGDYLNEYLTEHANKVFHGVGIFPQTGLNVVDYDLTPDALTKEGFSDEQARVLFDRIDPIAQDILGQSIVARRGSKGYAAFFNGELEKKTAITIRAPSGKNVTVIDLMAGHSVGVVLPPTVHPGTRKPYKWLTTKTLFNTQQHEHPALPVDALNQISDICGDFGPKKQKKVKKKASKGTKKQLHVSTTSDIQHLQWDAPITLDSGAQVSFADALEWHEGEYCLDPLNPERGRMKAIINHDCIHVFNSVQTRIYPEVIDLNCADTRQAYWEMSGNKSRLEFGRKLTGLDQAKWAYLMGKALVYRMGVDLPEPLLWVRLYYPNLSDQYAFQIARYLDWLLLARRKKSVCNYVLTRRDCYLSRNDQNRITWGDGIAAAKKSKLVGFRAEHGSGKTEQCAADYAKQHSLSFLAISHRVALTYQTAKKLHTDHYKEGGGFSGRLTVCLHSLVNEKRVLPHTQNIDCVLIDECSQVRRELANLKENRQEIYAELKRLLQQAQKVVLLDADLADVDVAFYEELAGCKAFVVDTAPSNKAFKTTIRTTTFNRGNLSEVCKHLDTGEACAIAFSSRKFARIAYKALVEQYPDKNIVLYAHAPEAPDLREIQQITQDPEGYFADVDCILFTSVMGTGFSIENPRFTKGFGFFGPSPLSPADCVQMLRRFRAITVFDVTIRLEHKLQDITTATATHKGLKHLRSVVAHERVQNKALFAHSLVELLKDRGHNIKMSTTAHWKVDSKSMDAADAEGVSVAVPIDPECISEHMKGEGLTSRELSYGICAFKCRTLFQIPFDAPLSVELAAAYIEDSHRLERYSLINNSSEPEWVSAREVLSLLLKARLNATDCTAIIRLVRKHSEDLKRIGCLPDRWAARGVPFKNIVGNTAELVSHFGLDSCLKANQGASVVCVSISKEAALISKPELNSKQDKKARAAALSEQGMTRQAIAGELKVSVRTVYSWIKSEPAKKVGNRQEGNNTLTVDSPPFLHSTAEQELLTDTVLIDGVEMSPPDELNYHAGQWLVGFQDAERANIVAELVLDGFSVAMISPAQQPLSIREAIEKARSQWPDRLQSLRFKHKPDGWPQVINFTQP